MERDDVIRLLQIAHAYDNRNVDEIMTRAWLEASRRGRWTATLAENAIHEHYARDVAFIMPGHITERLKADRQQPYRSEERPTWGKPNPALEGLPIPTEGTPVWAAYDIEGKDGVRAIDRVCPRCNSQPDEACMNPITKEALKIPCLSRLTGKDYKGKAWGA